MNSQNEFPFLFDSNACKVCGGKCCRGMGGYVWITIDELEKMAESLKIDVSIFSRQYVRQVQDRLSLKERVINGEHFCCFFDSIDCQCILYESRPRQCKLFPFWDKFKEDFRMVLSECPGVSLK